MICCMYSKTRDRAQYKSVAVLKDDEDVGIAEHGLCAHGLNVRCCEKCRDDRIGDLVFDDVGGLARPRRMNDHLHVGNVRQGVERNVTQGPDSCEHQQQRPREDEEAIVARTNQSIGKSRLHPSRGIHAQLLAGDELPVLFGDDRDLPGSPTLELCPNLHTVRSPLSPSVIGVRIDGHAHCGHRRHEKRDANFRPRNGRSIRIGEFRRGIRCFLSGAGSGRNSIRDFLAGRSLSTPAPAPGGGGTNEPSAA